MIYSKESKEYISNGHYLVDGVEFMSVYNFKLKFDLSQTDRTNRNVNEGGELFKICSVKHQVKPDFGKFDKVWVYPVEELKDFYGV